jgi:hypothetical protein
MRAWGDAPGASTQLRPLTRGPPTAQESAPKDLLRLLNREKSSKWCEWRWPGRCTPAQAAAGARAASARAYSRSRARSCPARSAQARRGAGGTGLPTRLLAQGLPRGCPAAPAQPGLLLPPPADVGTTPAMEHFSVGNFTGPDESRYYGTLKNGVPEGLGSCSWGDGAKYDGEWRAGLMHGFGTYVWKSGQRFDGEWKVGGLPGAAAAAGPAVQGGAERRRVRSSRQAPGAAVAAPAAMSAPAGGAAGAEAAEASSTAPVTAPQGERPLPGGPRARSGPGAAAGAGAHSRRRRPRALRRTGSARASALRPTLTAPCTTASGGRGASTALACSGRRCTAPLPTPGSRQRWTRRSRRRRASRRRRRRRRPRVGGRSAGRQRAFVQQRSGAAGRRLPQALQASGR